MKRNFLNIKFFASILMVVALISSCSSDDNGGTTPPTDGDGDGDGEPVEDARHIPTAAAGLGENP